AREKRSQTILTIEIPLHGPARRAVVILVSLSLAVGLVILVASEFVVGALADERADVPGETLAAAVAYFPSSAKLHARLAETLITEAKADPRNIESHAQQAVLLSPYNYEFRMLLASIQETRGNRAAAESSLHAAVRLAPSYTDPNWRLANLLLRQGKLDDSVISLREATRSDPSLVPLTFELLWEASNHNTTVLESVVAGRSADLLRLARFFVKQGRVQEAAEQLSRFEHAGSIASLETLEITAVIDDLIATGNLEAARRVWAAASGAGGDTSLLWNGSFETAPAKYSQFDWKITGNNYADVGVDTSTGHGGSSALRIQFKGRDTTRLDNQVAQLFLTRPKMTYSLDCWVKASGLATPEGPRVVVSESKSGKWIASSDPVSGGSSDWRPLHFEFVAPDVSQGLVTPLVVSIKRKPQFSYDDPTSGTVWFDDFVLSERSTNAEIQRHARTTSK
ncbi:MAG TPA: tetratricopeptide repeat protein, partial [Blastocatellia bacterium]|nr:tetratricopeptide repeat protein [Blastocatellia bacterium]